jgi:hypothetical protein
MPLAASLGAMAVAVAGLGWLGIRGFSRRVID